MSTRSDTATKFKGPIKWAAIAVILFLTFALTLNSFRSHKPNGRVTPKLTTHTHSSDDVSADTALETLKALSAQVQLVSDQNKKIIARDELVETEAKSSMSHLQQQYEDNFQQVGIRQAEFERNLQDKLRKHESINTDNHYQLADKSLANGLSDSADTLTWVDDLRSSFPDELDSLVGNEVKSAHMAETNNFTKSLSNKTKSAEKEIPIPRYTLPINSTLYDSVSWTGLIGRIPLNGVVRDPYPFKVIVGRKDFAANGIFIPDVEGIIVGGFAIGDLSMGCVRGNITSLTFVFPDGRISTKVSSTGSSEGGESKLGYLSTPNGNPCINGQYYGSAPEFLAGTVALAGAEGAAAAIAAKQTTNSTNAYGGNNSTVTGSPGKYMLGQAGVDSASAAAKWWAERQQNSFDAIYVSSNKPVAVNITQEIQIDYNPAGRKVFYEKSEKNNVATQLD